LVKKRFDHELDLKRNIGEPSGSRWWQCFSGDWIVSVLDETATARLRSWKQKTDLATEIGGKRRY
jgi:hypothetical protein